MYKACSGMASKSPARMRSTPSRVFSNATYLPGWPVKGSVVKKGWVRKRWSLLALATVRELAEQGLLEIPATPEEALDAYIISVKKGMLKTFSRMGISTIRSYFGAQIFEAVGLASGLVDRYFCGTTSRIEGIGLEEIAREATAQLPQAVRLDG